MKILGIKQTNYGGNKAVVYESTDTQVPFDVMIRNNLVDWTSQDSIYDLHRIKLKGVPAFKGIMTYKDVQKFAEFLVDRYEPTGSHAIDTTLKTCGLSRKKKISVLVEYLTKQYFDAIRFANRNPHSVVRTGVFALDDRKLLQNNEILSLLVGDSTVLFQAVPSRRMIYIEEPAGHIFMIIQRYNDAGLFWDGHKLDVINFNFSDRKSVLSRIIGEKTYARFENESRAIAVPSWKEFIAPADFVPEYIIKVPAKKDVDEDMVIKEGMLPDYIRPMFMFDMRGVVRAGKNVPVIEDTIGVVNILSRSTKCMYVPDEYPGIVNVNRYLEDKPYYMACGRIH
jgi:hypothetical protein